MMDDSNTRPNLELVGWMNSWLESSRLFGEGVAPSKLEAVDQHSLIDLMNSQPFGGGSGGGLQV